MYLLSEEYYLYIEVLFRISVRKKIDLTMGFKTSIVTTPSLYYRTFNVLLTPPFTGED